MTAAGDVSGSGLFGGGSAPKEYKDTLFSKSYMRFVDGLCEGPIEGLVDGGKSIFFDGTPLIGADDSQNFGNIAWAERIGTPDQDWMEGFSDQETETAVGVEASVEGGPVTRTIANPEVDAVSVKIRTPRFSRVTNDGDVKGASVQYAIRFRQQGAASWVQAAGSPFIMEGKSSSGFEEARRVQLRTPGSTAEGPWEIQVERLTADSASDKLQDTIVFQSFTEIIEVKMIYPDTAYIGVEVDAETIASVPQRAYEVKGLIVSVPTNYDPETRLYDGFWDGTFKQAWTDNPVWCFVDIVTNERYGLGWPMSRIDVEGLYGIAQYCDVAIDDGMGGTRPRYTLNVCIETQSQAFDLLNRFVANFHAMIYYSSGGLFVAQDAPRDPDIIVTPSQVLDGVFEYQDTSRADRHTVFAAKWNNPDLGYGADFAVYEDNVGMQKRGALVLDHELFGVAVRGQALYDARWLEVNETLTDETVTYRAGFDHYDVMPGMVAEIQDPSRAGISMGGRLLGVEDDEILLDRAVTLAADTDYQATILNTDKTVSTFDVVTGAGTHSTLQLASAPGSAAAGGVWAVSAGAETERWRIVTRAEVAKNVYEFAAVKDPADKHALIESDLELSGVFVPPGPVLGESIAAPAEISALQTVRSQPGAPQDPGLVIGWSQVTDPRLDYYEAQIQRADEPWSTVYSGSGLSVDVYGLSIGETVAFRVRAHAKIPSLLRSIWRTGSAEVEGRQEAPVAPTVLSVTAGPGVNSLRWVHADENDIDVYEVYRGLSDDFEAAIGIGSTATDAYEDRGIINGVTYWYWVRAVAFSGQSTQSELLGPESVEATGWSIDNLDSDMQTLLEALSEVGDGTFAEGLFAIQAAADQDGAEARIALAVRASTEDGFSEAGIYIEAFGGGLSGITMLADSFAIVDVVDGLSQVPFSYSAGALRLKAAKIDDYLESDGFAADGDGNPLSGWRLDRDGTLRAANAILSGELRSVDIAAERTLELSTPIVRNGMFDVFERLEGRYVRGNTSFYFTMIRTPDYIRIEDVTATFQTTTETIPLIATQAILPGNVGAKVTMIVGSQHWWIGEEGQVWLFEGDDSDLTRPVGRVLYPMAWDPLNTLGATKVYGKHACWVANLDLQLETMTLPKIFPIRVPDGVDTLRFRGWGAGGAGGGTSGGIGGPGGYVSGDWAVTPGEIYQVVVGVGGYRSTDMRSLGFGGGGSRADGVYGGGGGLTGLFKGRVGRGNAIMIAGGGGGAARSLPGGAGGSTASGAEAGSNGLTGDIAQMQGLDHTTSGDPAAAGGGGYEGGGYLAAQSSSGNKRAGRGGTSFTHADVASPTTSTGTRGTATAPQASHADRTATDWTGHSATRAYGDDFGTLKLGEGGAVSGTRGGNGLAVIEWLG